MEDQLAFSLLSSLTAQMEVDEETKGWMDKAKFVLRRGVSFAVQAGLEKFAGETGKEAGKEFGDVFEGKIDLDTAQAIANLRTQFEKGVKQTCTKKKRDRIVFFIDDLDRLNPAKAVELLEVMKLFFDCPKCVFVLAIDYDVVVRGVEAKYGQFSSDKRINEAKGRSFFDKIIQVPFKMPVGNYKLSNYIQTCLSNIGITDVSDDDLRVYEELINLSIGANPRSMKRLFNSFLLLTYIVDDKILEADKNKLLLFAVLCMQATYEDIYNIILRNSNEQNAVKAMEMLRTAPMENLEKEFGRIDLRGAEENRFRAFMETFFNLLDKNCNEGLDANELRDLQAVLALSSSVNASGTEEKKTKRSQYLYREKAYKSGGRNGANIGGLAHDIMADVAKEHGWTKADTQAFQRAYYEKSPATGWLNEVVLFKDEVDVLTSDPAADEGGTKDPVTKRYKTDSMEAFANRFINLFNNAKTSVPFDQYQPEMDPNMIPLADGNAVFIARWWGDPTLKNLLDILRDTFGICVDVEQV